MLIKRKSAHHPRHNYDSSLWAIDVEISRCVIATTLVRQWLCGGVLMTETKAFWDTQRINVQFLKWAFFMMLTNHNTDSSAKNVSYVRLACFVSRVECFVPTCDPFVSVSASLDAVWVTTQHSVLFFVRARRCLDGNPVSVYYRLWSEMLKKKKLHKKHILHFFLNFFLLKPSSEIQKNYFANNSFIYKYNYK